MSAAGFIALAVATDNFGAGGFGGRHTYGSELNPETHRIRRQQEETNRRISETIRSNSRNRAYDGNYDSRFMTEYYRMERERAMLDLHSRPITPAWKTPKYVTKPTYKPNIHELELVYRGFDPLSEENRYVEVLTSMRESSTEPARSWVSEETIEKVKNTPDGVKKHHWEIIIMAVVAFVGVAALVYKMVV